MNNRIYLDNNATTPVDSRVLKAILDTHQNVFGNPSSIHSFGQEARKLLNHSREIIASFLGVKPQEIFFTSGGTESMNMLIRGLCSQYQGGNIISSDIEHSCVYNTVKAMQALGYKTTLLSTGLQGNVTPELLESALTSDTRFIVLSSVNNETGVKSDVAALAKVAQQANIPLVIDGVAQLGKEPLSIPPGVSAMGFSSHKIHAPKGSGVVYIKQGLKLSPLITGGTQEYNKRAGTENLSGIVGMATAIGILHNEQSDSIIKMEALRDKFETGILEQLPFVTVNGEGPRVCNTSNLAFNGIDGESLLMKLDREGLAASHGSACTSGALEPSRILINMGIPLNAVRSSLRFSLSRMTTEDEIERAIKIIVAAAKRPK